MSTHIFYYNWTIEIGCQEPEVISVYADSLEDAYASISREAEKLSEVVHNPPRYIIDQVATNKLRMVAAALHTSFDKNTADVKNTTLPERFMLFLGSVEPNISSVKHYGLRLDRGAPVIC